MALSIDCRAARWAAPFSSSLKLKGIAMTTQDNNLQDDFRVLAREVAQELDLAELAQVSGGDLPRGVCTINAELDENLAAL
jgi:hypothetical protein